MAGKIKCISRNARKTCEEQWDRKEICVYGVDIRYIHFRELLLRDDVWTLSENEPLYCSKDLKCPTPSRFGEGETLLTNSFWLYKNRMFEESHDEDYDFNQRKLLILEEFDKERRQFEKLHAKFSTISTATPGRSKIPSGVRIFVWQRDGGRCVECGSNENLEYDHIIPFAKGGSNTERNLQLLCGNCNRLKSDNIQ